MSVALPRRSFAALALAALVGVSCAIAQAQSGPATLNGTVVSANATSIVVRSNSGTMTYVVHSPTGEVLAAGVRATSEPITISGERERATIGTFATSTMNFVAADVAADGTSAILPGGGSVALDWGITKPVVGKNLVFMGRLVGRASGVTFIVAATPQPARG